VSTYSTLGEQVILQALKTSALSYHHDESVEFKES